MDADPQDALTRFDDAAGDEWVGEAAAAAEQLGAGLDDLNATMKASVDGTTIDVASAEAAANTFTERARGAMDTCVTAAHQAAS
ncbi:hypothetical protein ACO229_07130 [Promicromonospora sp. MS192]|uniref:hypothetical protein n=1 Tax=Promicromonospora sp. MS192 TaxID=3412684 RepID=UPI003C2E23F9